MKGKFIVGVLSLVLTGVSNGVANAGDYVLDLFDSTNPNGATFSASSASLATPGQ